MAKVSLDTGDGTMMTNQVTDPLFRLPALRDRTVTAPQLQISLQENHHVFIRDQTIRYRRHEVGLHVRPVGVFVLSRENRTHRLQWAPDHANRLGIDVTGLLLTESRFGFATDI